MLKRKLSRVQYGIVLLVLSTFVLGLVAVVGDSISTYLTFTLGDTQEPSGLVYNGALWEYNATILVDTYRKYDDSVGKLLLLYGANNTVNASLIVIVNVTGEFDSAIQGNYTPGGTYLATIEYASNWSLITLGNSGGPDSTLLDFAIDRYVAGTTRLIITKTGSYYDIYNSPDVDVYVYTYAGEHTPVSTGPTLNLGFIVNVILAFAGIYMLVKGIYYIGGIKV